jgi:nucleotide-binding universal stress UspA family protein
MSLYKVVVPLDGSPFSRQILPALCRLFPPQHYTLVLLRVTESPGHEHVLDMPFVAPSQYFGSTAALPLYTSVLAEELMGQEAPHAEMVERVRHELEAELRDIAHCLQGYEVSVAVRFGDPAAEIVRFVAEEQVDFVAMATHARGGVPRMVLGSVASGVLRHVAVPVLLVRPVEQAEPRTEAVAEPQTAGMA